MEDERYGDWVVEQSYNDWVVYNVDHEYGPELPAFNHEAATAIAICLAENAV